MIQWWLVELAANTVISAAYLCITVLIVVPLIQLNQVRTNRLALATAAIFFSCSMGHGLHALHGVLSDHSVLGTHSAGVWWLTVWHVLTACVAVYYLTLRRFYGRLLSGAPLYHNLTDQQRLRDLETLQAEVNARTTAESERDHYAMMLRTINRNHRAMIFVKDLQGRYLMLNEAAEAVLGASEAELLGKTDDYLHPEHAAAWQAADRKALAGPYQVEEHIGSDHPRIFESTKFPMYDSDGQVYATCGIAIEVTESKRINAELAQARDAALAATEAKSAFLATMSHEIRTPMNAVIGMTDLLLDTRLDEQQNEFLETVRASGNALLSVINDILDFSKIESGELRLVTGPFNLRDEVEGAMDLVVAAATTKGLDLVCYIDDSCPSRVVGDAAHLRQILLNLLANAVKFTAVGEVLVTVRAEAVADGAIRATIDVTDSGIGISAEGVQKLFRSFSQVDASPTRAYGGTGLGLAISKRLAQAMGGDVTVSSILGEGTTFTVTLAFEPAEDTGQDERRRAPDPALAGVSVLIVDDNQTNLRILDLQLTALEMNCTTAASPAEALAKVAGGLRYDVALLDMNMPTMDGVELARQLRSLPSVNQAPLVLLTSMGSRPLDSEVHFASVLAKPIKNVALRAALGSALNGSLDVSEAARSRRQGLHPNSRPLRVLLAEDNPVNQRVAQLMLDKLGHQVDIVDNGCAAVEAVTTSEYDVVLMDVQMPLMDGLQATRKIRGQLPAEQQPHIIAMTANALLEDQEACSAAGMESYLTKPVRIADLKAMLTRVSATIRGRTPPTGHATPAEPGEAGRPPPVHEAELQPPINEAVLAELAEDVFDEDGSLVRELIGKFLDTGASTMPALVEAAQAGRAEEVARLAHSLISSSELLGALQLGSLLRRAQESATGSPAALAPLAAELEGEYARVSAHLEQASAALVSPPSD